MINILIVDDSITEVALLKKLFESQSDMKVIGCASNGKEAVKLAERLKPDLITMDIQMPVMDGYEATHLIMTKFPIPIVVISAKANDAALDTTFRALEAGALSVLGKPFNFLSPESKNECRNIIDTIRSMSEIKVIKRRYIKSKGTAKKQPSNVKIDSGEFEIVAIGASIGGPQVLRKILGALPADFQVPIVIVQHMTQGFINGFTKWLDNSIDLIVKEAEDNEILKKGTIYFAPDSKHLEVRRLDNKLVARLINNPPVSGFCPSATVLLQSVAKTCGKNSIGILLTGMGSDGAQGLLELNKAHGHTFIQDPESAVVFGMAGVAQSLGAVDKVVELEKIAGYLKEIIKR